MVLQRAVRGVVRGRVQGVAYRASLRREALVRGSTGWVCNRPDGSVEFVVQGDSGAVQEILDWARTGPASARVTDVVTRETDFDPGLTHFEIR